MFIIVFLWKSLFHGDELWVFSSKSRRSRESVTFPRVLSLVFSSIPHYGFSENTSLRRRCGWMVGKFIRTDTRSIATASSGSLRVKATQTTLELEKQFWKKVQVRCRLHLQGYRCTLVRTTWKPKDKGKNLRAAVRCDCDLSSLIPNNRATIRFTSNGPTRYKKEQCPQHATPKILLPEVFNQNNI